MSSNEESDGEEQPPPKKINSSQTKNHIIKVAASTHQILSRVRQSLGESSLESVILKLLTHSGLSKHIRQFKILPFQDELKILTLPFALRLKIIYFTNIELKFCIKDHQKIKSFQKGKSLIKKAELIAEYYGYFSADFDRKIYLIFKRVAYKMRRFKKDYFDCILPRNRRVKSLRLCGGELDNKDDQGLLKCFPDSFLSGRVSGIKCFVITSVNKVNVKAILEIVKASKFLTRFKMAQCSLHESEEDEIKSLIKEISRLVSVSIIVSRGIPSDTLNILLQSTSICKLALGGMELENLTFGFGNNILTKLFLQNNESLCPYLGELNYNNLREINLSHTSINYQGVQRLLEHGTLRKLVISHCNFESMPRDANNTLSKVPKLEQINLNKTKFSKVFAKLISRCVNLTTLLLGKTRIKSDVFNALNVEKMNNLQHICLAWIPSLDGIVDQVLRVKSLRKFVCPQFFISESIVIRILKSESIEKLSIRSKSSSLFSPMTLRTFRENRKLTYLNVAKQCDISEEITFILKHYCSSIQTLKYSSENKEIITWKRPSMSF